jgi:hypothetical protein
LGVGAISWDSYKFYISQGQVVDFCCSYDYDGSKNHNALGVGYIIPGGTTHLIKYYDPYDDTVKTQEYNYYKTHYWYETNYNVTKQAI